MIELRDDADFAREAVTPQRGGQLGPEDLERYLATVLEVLGQIDGRHAAGTDLPLEGIPV